jgi:dienelactone hydrolase
MIRRMILLFAPFVIGVSPINAEKVEFPSGDDLTITADVYFADQNDHGLPFVCLFHQAGFSRGEYQEIAPRLVELGYNCMAVDARSGKQVNGVVNETAQRAQDAKKGQDYGHALPDIVAALQYARDNYADGPLIAWGSSYSASLVLKASAENEDLVDGTLSFAPNSTAVWTREWILETPEMVKHPVFLTSARKEQMKWKRLLEAFPESQVTAFVPKSAGRHGSRALWKEQRDNEVYWEAVEEFLTTNFPPAPTEMDDAAPTAGADKAMTTVSTRPARPASNATPKEPMAAGGHGEGHANEPTEGHGGGHGKGHATGKEKPEGHGGGHGKGHATGEEKPEGHGKPGK